MDDVAEYADRILVMNMGELAFNDTCRNVFAHYEELEAMGAGALRLAVQEGDKDRGCYLAGQIASMVTRPQSAAEILREVAEGAEPLLREAAKWVK